MNQVFASFFKNPEKNPVKTRKKTFWKNPVKTRKKPVGKCGEYAESWGSGDVVTDRGRTTHVPARGKTRKKPGSIFRRPPTHRPLLAGAEINSMDSFEPLSFKTRSTTTKDKNSGGIKRDKLKGTNGAKFAVFRRFWLIFADFRFSWELQHFGSADFRRKPQEPADFCRNRFVPFSLSLLIPP